ncbi:FecR family protein [Wenyingzhuangia sp. IMCC45467]
MKNTDDKLRSILEEILNTGVLDISKLQKLEKEEQELIRDIYQSGQVKEALQFLTSVDVDVSWQGFYKRVKPKTNRFSYRHFYKYAAALVFLLGSSYFLYQYTSTKEAPFDMTSSDIALILENGETKALNEYVNFTVIKNKGRAIVNQTGNQISYKNVTLAQKTSVYHKLCVPYGKTFNIVLSDGTKVHLNSGTVLKFPQQFIAGQKRTVFLEGEAYFEVAKDSLHPFIVNANNMDVTVLGTKFNVSTYHHPNEVHTVLVEGSVSLSNHKEPQKNTLLKPGYKATWNTETQNINIAKVNPQLYTSWMNGELVFNDVTFKQMIKKLERTYNINIVNNHGLLESKMFNARFSIKIESIEDVLSSIGELYPLTYEKEENKIIINP